MKRGASSLLVLGLLVSATVLAAGEAPQARGAEDRLGRAVSKPENPRLSSALDRLAREAEVGAPIQAKGRRYVGRDGRTITAVVELADLAKAEAVSAEVEALGGTVEIAVQDLLQVKLPATALRRLAEHEGVRLLRPPHYATPKVTSEGASVIHAPEFRARYGADGAGVRVGVMDAFGRVSDVLGAGELPASTEATPSVLSLIQSGAYGDGVHGTACAEIIHDIAPGAQLVLGAYGTDAEFLAGVNELLAEGVHIISASIGFDNVWPPDGTSLYSQAVDSVFARGVLWVGAAGNEAQGYFQGTLIDSDGDGLMEFPDGHEALLVEGDTVRLRWDEPFGRAGQDFDLYVMQPTAACVDNATSSCVLASSIDFQNGASVPVETVDGEAGAYLVAVVRAGSAPAAQRFWIWVHGSVEPGLQTASSTLSLPGDARGSLTVGAVDWRSLQLEGYSSRGPTADGRIKPDVVGPTNVSTLAYTLVGNPVFNGTSAATPHVAGVAALLKSAVPSATAAQLYDYLQTIVRDGGPAGKDNDFGAGLVDLNLAQ
jgi:subtilisin family serine protease